MTAAAADAAAAGDSVGGGAAAAGIVASCTLTFSNTNISQRPSSSFGWWIRQNGSAPKPVVNYSTVDAAAGGFIATWPMASTLPGPTAA